MQHTKTLTESTTIEELSEQPSWAVVGAIVLMATLAMATAVLGGSALLVATVVLVSGTLAAVVATKSLKDRSRHMSRMVQEYQDAMDHWRHRQHLLQQEAQQTSSALAKMRDGVIMLAESGDVLLINPSACRLLNVTPDSNPRGRRLVETVRIPELKQAITATRAGEGVKRVLIEVPDGNIVRPVKIRVEQFAAGKENEILITLRDETESRRVDEMRREFVANISHELKTPLAAIKGYAETVELAIKDDPDAAGHFMSQIHSQCLRLERLIADMMQLARAQAGPSHLKIATVEVADVIAESLKSYRPVAESKGIQLRVEPGERSQIQSDREALLTIVNNLIGNAIRHTSSGGNVTVGTLDRQNRFELYVDDDGVGIPLSEQKRIFERFYRVEKTRSSGDEGTGIGLSIVKNLAMALGGEVRVESEPGEGARFSLSLPANDFPPPK